jgi:hypothetical protein
MDLPYASDPRDTMSMRSTLLIGVLLGMAACTSSVVSDPSAIAPRAATEHH